MAKVDFIGNRKTSPPFIADFGGREHMAVFPAKADAAQFQDALAIIIDVGAAGAAGGAVSVPILPAAAPALAAATSNINTGILIPKGSKLTFGANSNKIAVLNADVKIGDTNLTTLALPTALVDADVARWSPFGRLFLPAGTLVGRTYAERDAGTPFGPAVVATDDEIYLTCFDVEDLNSNNDIELIRQGVRIKENYLPDWANAAIADANYKAKVRALYSCILGQD